MVTKNEPRAEGDIDAARTRFELEPIDDRRETRFVQSEAMNRARADRAVAKKSAVAKTSAG